MPTHGRVLIVEDDPAVREVLAEYLGGHGYDVVEADRGTAMREAVERNLPDVVLLDVNLPGEDGLTLARFLRERFDVGIIMVTGATDVADRVAGLEVGADDYVTKPFGVRELLARLRAVLRRAQTGARGERLLRFDDIEVDFRSHELRRDGRPIEATRKEIGLLRFLSSRPGEVIRRDALLEAVWGYTAETTTRTVDNHVALLRAKIEADPKSPRHLVTVHGVGYKWVP